MPQSRSRKTNIEKYYMDTHNRSQINVPLVGCELSNEKDTPLAMIDQLDK